MDGAAHLVVAEHVDHPDDLPPAAEMDDIAEIAAAARPLGGLDHGKLAKAFEQLARVDECRPVGKKHIVTQRTLLVRKQGHSPVMVAILRSFILNALFTMNAPKRGSLAPERATCHGSCMEKRDYTQAGGFILAASIIAGAVGGTMVGQSSIGFVVGTGTGVLLALLIWWIDRRR